MFRYNHEKQLAVKPNFTRTYIREELRMTLLVSPDESQTTVKVRPGLIPWRFLFPLL